MNGHWNDPEIERPQSWPERVQTAVRESVGPDDIAKADSQSTKMLLALRATGKHIYEGTVPAAVKARRRARNKRARHARRAAR